ncbi:MAG: ATP-binding protein [Acidimicrobiia bacterium]|jgi:serine/threonine-protein kinase RsbW
MTVRQTFPAEVTSVAAARRFVAGELADLGARVETVVLLVSELATNAVRHATSAFELSIERSNGLVRVEVADQGAGTPQKQPHDIEAPSGRGLQILEALADEWGVTERQPGKAVWFTLGLTSRPD